jgi:diguanylate cyclase (GGDEF)-like protein/PAS domain S-box-containing protein
MHKKPINMENKFHALVESSFVAIYIMKDGKFIYTNKKFQDLFEYSEDEMHNKTAIELTHPDDVALVMKKLKERADTIGLGTEYTFRGIKKSGKLLDAHVYGSSFLLDNEKAIIGTLIDDTEKNQDKKQLEKLANFDTLTQLFNRNYFNTQLEHSINLAKRYKQKVALFLFDIDNFKRVNDSLGHIAGDTIIQQIAHRISKILRDSDTFCRIGGDEFTLIIENFKTINDLTSLVGKIENVMEEGIKIDDITFHISLSIGVSIFPQNAETPIQLQKTADMSMYEAKKNGKNCSVFYHKKDIEKTDKIKLEDELFKAYENKEIELYLQPQISVDNEKLIGAEALIRWNHPTEGILSPIVFLEIAEEVGLLYKLDLFMLEKALEILRRYNKIDEFDFTISVNVSNALFMHQKFIPTLKELVFKYKEESKFIQLELTEHIAMNYEVHSMKTIKALKYLGFKLSVDDFGTGYSSLNHLKMLDIDELKIDKSFIDDITIDKVDRSIVKAIIGMCKALSLKTVAEGVENKMQLDILKELECDIIQGYYYSKPVSLKAFEAKWLN